MTMTAIGFIGLGVMGFPMAGHLKKAGYDVCVFNRSEGKAVAWQEKYGGRIAESPKQAAAGAELVFSCVGNDDDLRQVVLGPNGIAEGVDKGTILIDHTTASAEVARDIASQLSELGCGFVDAPVSGGEPGAKSGQLTIMAGGAEADFKAAAEAMRCYGRAMQLLGPVGSGQLCKMVNQICIAGLLQGLAEALNFSSLAGLDTHQVVDVISKGAAQSWQMDNRHQSMLAEHYDHGFAVDLMRKDLSIVIKEAAAIGAPLPVTALVDQFYGDVQTLGGGRWDTSSLLKRLQVLQTLSLPPE